MSLFKKVVSSLNSIRIPFPRFSSAKRYIADHRQGFKRWGGRVGIAGASTLIVLLIHRSIYMFVVGQPAFSVKQTLAKVDVAPNWADPRSGDGRVNFRVDGAEWNLFDDTLVARIGRSFEENPWVRRVTSVERIFPDQISVKFDVRKPQLALQKTNGIYLVDSDGVRLPGVYSDLPEGHAVMKVSGATSVPPSAGQRWTHAEIATALEMARAMAGDPVFERAGVTAVDVSNLGGRIDRRRVEICLVTSNGCTIEWGRLPSSRSTGEIPMADKLDNFRQVLETYPGLADRLRVKLYASGKGEFPPTVPRETQAAVVKPKRK